MTFAISFSQGGKVMALGEHAVKTRLHESQKHRMKCENFARKYAANTVTAVANLSEIVKKAPPNKKRRADAAGLTHALRAATAYCSEVVKTKKGKALDKVVDDQDEQANAVEEDDDEFVEPEEL